jgi:hypothetical protein
MPHVLRARTTWLLRDQKACIPCLAPQSGAGNSPAAPMNVGATTRITTKAATELGAVMLHLQVIDDRP